VSKDKAQAAAAEAPKPISRQRKMEAFDIIKAPVITEKATALSALDKYTFKVDLNANKIQIRQAIQAIFGVTVVKVATSILPGKTKRRGKDIGTRSDVKKAIVTLKPGQQIEFNGRPLFEV
jgi:large subunit ribosomal protein L23